MMKPTLKKLFILATWLFVCLSWWQSLLFLNHHRYVHPPFSVHSLNSKQHQLYEKYLSENQKLTLEIFKNELGEVVYRYHDKFYGEIAYQRDAPEWYKNGEVVLTEKQKHIISDAALISRPGWFFWTNPTSIEVSQYNNLFDVLSSGLATGLSLGVFVVIFSWLRAQGLNEAGIYANTAALAVIFVIFYSLVTVNMKELAIYTVTAILIVAIHYLAKLSGRLWRNH